MAVKEVVSGDEGAVRIRGYASTPDIDRYRDIVEPSAFKDALSLYLKNPVLLRSHDADRPIGVVEVATVTDQGLWIEAVVKDVQTAKEIEEGLMRTLSIGYIAKSTELQHEDGTPFNWEEDSPWDPSLVRVIKELDLVEISVVSTPANGNALFSMAKSFESCSRQLALKSFGIEVKDGSDDAGVPAEQAESEEGGEEAPEAPVEAPEEEAPEGEETAQEEPEAPDEEPEAPEEEKAEEDEEKEPAGEADETPKEDAEPSDEEPAEDAENAGESPVADDAEGGDAEEADADAEPEGEPEEGAEDAEEDEQKAIIVTKDVAELLPTLKAVGAIREPEGEEKAEQLSGEVVSLMQKLHDVAASENKRANDLQAKLDGTPEKKAIAPHRQFGAEDETLSDEERKSVTQKKQASQWFMGLFNKES